MRTISSHSIVYLAASILLTGVFVIAPYDARAQVDVPISGTALHGWRTVLTIDFLKDFVFKTGSRIAARGIIDNISDQIVGWIKGDHGKNTGFVGNLQQELRKTGDDAGAEFLNGITNINFCGNIGSFLQLRLRGTRGFDNQAACTVTGIRGNLQNYYQNFRNGGWSSFIQTTIEPNNNAYGSFLIAYDAKLQAEGAAQQTKQDTLVQNRGFLGFQVEKQNCEAVLPENLNYCPDVPDDELPKDDNGNVTCIKRGDPNFVGPQQFCHTEKVTETPGGLVADTLSQAVGSRQRFAEVSDSIDAAIASITGALINKVIASGAGLFHDNSAGTATSSTVSTNVPPPTQTSSLTDTQLFLQIESILLGAPMVNDSLNDSLTTAEADLIATRKEIASIELAPAFSIPRLNDLRKQAADEETAIKNHSTQKQHLLTGLDRLFQFTGDQIAGHGTLDVTELIGIIEEFNTANPETQLPDPSSDIPENVLTMIQSMKSTLGREAETLMAVAALPAELPQPPVSATASTSELITAIGAATAGITQYRQDMQNAVRNITAFRTDVEQARAALDTATYDSEKKNAETDLNKRMGEALAELAADAHLMQTAHRAVTAIRQQITEYLALIAP